MTRRAAFVATAIVATLAASRARGEPRQATMPPAFQDRRYEERYDYLASDDAPESLVDRIKFIGLGANGNFRLSLGGEVRLRYQSIENPTWGEDADEPAIFLQRYMAHADLWWKARARAFVQLRSTFTDGQDGPPSPVAEDQLAFNQAFVEVHLPSGSRIQGGVRVGRQEVALGSQRLVAVREGPNNRRRFDGFRLDVRWDRWSASALALRLANDNREVFDDDTNDHVALWGLYTVGRNWLTTPLCVDLYYLGLNDENAAYEQGTGSETRHTLGTRLWGESRGWDWNWELAYQFGNFAGGTIEAWTVATDTGFTFDAVPWTPRFGFNANVASGDRNPADKDLQTFSPLFPRGNYFDHLALLGPQNFFNVHPGVTLNPRQDVELRLDVNALWRQSTDDGLYDPAGNLLRASDGSNKRFAGTALSGGIGWQVNRYLLLETVYTHIFPGAFIRATGPAQDIDFLELTMQLRF